MPAPAALSLKTVSILPGDRICAAVSGGADSVALLLSLHQQRKALGVGLSAVHVHHGLRGAEADLDQQFVQELCRRLDTPLHLRRVDVNARRAALEEGVEEAARHLRYQVFHELLGSGEADAVLTAHTLNDQAETVLMKLLRGAWTEGLGGIHPVLAVATPGGRGGKILRPLLDTTRSAVESYLHDLRQPWREDATNSDPAFTRNRIRHTLLPLLRQENPSIDRTLANLAELAREEQARWQTELDRLLPQILLPGAPVRGGGRSVSTQPGAQAISLETERLRPLDNALRRRVLRAAAGQLGVRLNFDETSRMLALCGFRDDPTVAAQPSTVLHLSGGLLARRSPRELRLSLAPSTEPIQRGIPRKFGRKANSSPLNPHGTE